MIYPRMSVGLILAEVMPDGLRTERFIVHTDALSRGPESDADG